MEENKNFFKEVWTSIKDFEKYEEFAAEKVSKAIKYILILTIIFTLAISLTYTYKFYITIQDAKNYIEQNIEEIKIEDGILEVSLEEPIIIENENNVIPIIIIDTSEKVDKNKHIEKIKLYDTGIVFLSDKAIIVSSMLTEEQSIEYSNIFTLDIENKGEFIDLISGKNMTYTYVIFGLTIFIYLFVIYFTSNLVDGIVLGVLGYLFARIIKLRLRFKATFNIGIYALTLPIILNLIYIIVNTFTGFTINYFQWMYTTISYIYVIVAILMIKTEIINQKIQLIKLQEIQKKVVEEEVEERPEKEQKKEKKDKKEENEKENNNEDEAPEGSKA